MRVYLLSAGALVVYMVCSDVVMGYRDPELGAHAWGTIAFPFPLGSNNVTAGRWKLTVHGIVAP